MERIIRIKNIVGGSDIAELFGVDRVTVTQWEKRHDDFPSPIARVNGSSTKLWNREAVLAWGRLTQRLPLEPGHTYDRNGYDTTHQTEAS